jgi:hypothetical protein
VSHTAVLSPMHGVILRSCVFPKNLRRSQRQQIVIISLWLVALYIGTGSGDLPIWVFIAEVFSER